MVIMKNISFNEKVLNPYDYKNLLKGSVSNKYFFMACCSVLFGSGFSFHSEK